MKPKAATALGILLVLAGFGQAQDTGALKIVVTDKNGGVIPSASIHLAGVRAVNLIADAHGIALAQGLAPGDCSIAVSASGFASKEIRAVTVVANKTKVVQLKLEETYTGFPIPTYDTLQPEDYSNHENECGVVGSSGASQQELCSPESLQVTAELMIFKYCGRPRGELP